MIFPVSQISLHIRDFDTNLFLWWLLTADHHILQSSGNNRIAVLACYLVSCRQSRCLQLFFKYVCFIRLYFLTHKNGFSWWPLFWGYLTSLSRYLYRRLAIDYLHSLISKVVTLPKISKVFFFFLNAKSNGDGWNFLSLLSLGYIY